MSYSFGSAVDFGTRKAATQSVRLPHNDRAQPKQQWQRRGRSQTIRMAVAETSTQRLTKEDLVEYLAAGIKPETEYRCGDGAFRTTL